MSSDPVKNVVDLAAKTVELAVKAGADAAEVVVADGAEMSAKVRLGKVEEVHEAMSRGVGMRLFVDGRSASSSSADVRPDALQALVEETVTLARLAEPDPLNILPDKELMAKDIRDLELFDPKTDSVDAGAAIERLKEAESAALEFDKRITNSDGATWSRSTSASAFANSLGFAHGYRGSYSSFFVQPICEDEDEKKRNGSWWTANRFLDKLDSPESVGKEAARRTLAQLGARKVDTCDVPVVFDREVGRSLVGMVFSVANGSSFYRKSSYLLEREGTKVASDLVTIVDEPLIPRAPGSRPFDGDGLQTRNNTLVNAGVLETVLCDVYSARKLGRESTGSAGRGLGGAPAPTTSNLIMKAGKTPAKDVTGQVKNGLYVTSMMGFGFNPVTGDFSRGAQGFWIEDGELAFPVSEITISANFDDLLQRIDCVGDDLDMRTSTACPTFRVSKMTVAGR